MTRQSKHERKSRKPRSRRSDKDEPRRPIRVHQEKDSDEPIKRRDDNSEEPIRNRESEARSEDSIDFENLIVIEKEERKIDCRWKKCSQDVVEIEQVSEKNKPNGDGEIGRTKADA